MSDVSLFKWHQGVERDIRKRDPLSQLAQLPRAGPSAMVSVPQTVA